MVVRSLSRGKAQPNGTWHTMLRQRLLLRGPGAAEQPVGPAPCGRAYRDSRPCGRVVVDADDAHQYVCPVQGLQEARHDRVVQWACEKIKEHWGERVQSEQRVAPPLVRSEGRMDVVATRHGQCLLIDVAIATVATDSVAELTRRSREPGRALRTAEARKFARYGSAVLALAVEDTGRLGSGTRRLLRELAEAQEVVPVGVELGRLVAELQHVVLSSTATML